MSPRPPRNWKPVCGQRTRSRARRELSADRDDLHADARARLDRVLLEAALERTGGHRTEAAARLGVGRNTVTRKLGSGRKPRSAR